MRILITGASGYLGRNLVKNFLRNKENDLCLLSRKINNQEDVKKYKVGYYNGTYESLFSIFNKFQPDLVVHCAALSEYFVKDNVDALIDSNFRLIVHLLQAMLETNCNKIINTGSFWQTDENGKNNPNCLYAALKATSEDIINYYVERHALTAITLRLTDVYGPDDSRKKLISMLIEAITKNMSFFETTKAEQLTNFVYITDVVNAYEKAISLIVRAEYQKSHSIYYIAEKENVSLKEAITFLLEITKSSLVIKWGEKPYRQNEIMKPYIGNMVPTWSPLIDFQTGFKLLLNSKKSIPL